MKHLISRPRRGFGNTNVANVFESITGLTATQTTNPINKYKIVITYMENDADGYPTETVYMDGDKEKELIEFMNFLNRCAVAYMSGKGGSDDFSHVEGYKDWVINEDVPEEEQPNALIEWRYWDWEYCCDFEHADVYYYDANGVEYKVNMQ
ncbi:MAG: hypothetical protein ACRCWQ_02180 [Bacilli bacterium]